MFVSFITLFNSKSSYFEWKRSSGWLESWEGRFDNLSKSHLESQVMCFSQLKIQLKDIKSFRVMHKKQRCEALYFLTIRFIITFCNDLLKKTCITREKVCLI